MFTFPSTVYWHPVLTHSRPPKHLIPELKFSLLMQKSAVLDSISKTLDEVYTIKRVWKAFSIKRQLQSRFPKEAVKVCVASTAATLVILITLSSTMLSFEGSLHLYEGKALHKGKLESLHLNSAVWADWCSCCLKLQGYRPMSLAGTLHIQVLWNVVHAFSPSVMFALQAGRGFEHLHLELRILCKLFLQRCF